MSLVRGIRGSVESALLDEDILSDDQPVRSHFLKPGQHTLYMFLKIHEYYDDRKVSSRFHETGCMYLVPSVETTDCVEGAGPSDIFRAKHFQQFMVQRLILPLIVFVQVDGYLDCGIH